MGNIEDDEAKVQAELKLAGCDDAQIEVWLSSPNPGFSDRIPRELIAEGRVQEILDVLINIALGGSG